MRKIKKSVRVIPLWGLAVLVLTALRLSGAAHLCAAPELQGTKPATQWEDPDYWVHIRNVSIFDPATYTLDENMFVLVVGNLIHKTGKVPMMIFDKDLTFNYDGERRILMLSAAATQHLPALYERAGTVKEGEPADLLVIDVRTLDELHEVMARPQWSDSQQRAKLETVKLILKNGWVIKDTLPTKRIDEFRLKRVKKKRQEMGIATN